MGSLYYEQSSKCQNMVAVAKKPQGSLGKTLGEEICTKCGGKKHNSVEWGQPRLLNLDSG